MNIGIVTPSPAIANGPTSLIAPIKALSTILYKDVINILKIAGTEYLISNLLIFSSAKLSIFFIFNLLIMYIWL